MLQIVGSCDKRLFGITPAERLRRQWDGEALTLVASAGAVLGDTALAWLRDNPGTALVTDSGRAVAVAVEPREVEAASRAIGSGEPGMKAVRASAVGDAFIRKLRRRDKLFVRSLDEEPVAAVEKQLFDTVYKGVTDLVTKYAWPVPALWVTRLCARAGLHPNVVTFIGMFAMLAATLLWVQNQIAAGLVAAWLMTFLDTVDGKLARVTVTSSELGNKLDHLTDVIHPPIWWAALASALIDRPGEVSATRLWQATAVILIGYVVGRIVESTGKKRFGFNPFLWRPFDSAFRTIVSRRNIILLIMTAGLISGDPDKAFVAAAVWTFVSVAIQLVRFVQGTLASRRGPLTSWLV